MNAMTYERDITALLVVDPYNDFISDGGKLWPRIKAVAQANRGSPAPRRPSPLARATETSVRHAPGFISASLHRGLDGTKVTMYAQWRSVEDYETMRRDPTPMPYLQQALAIAKFDPGMYEVVETCSGTTTEQ